MIRSGTVVMADSQESRVAAAPWGVPAERICFAYDREGRVPCHRNLRFCSTALTWRGTGCVNGQHTAGQRPAGPLRRGELRFAFYGRVSTEDHQDPVASWARQRDLAATLVAGHGRI